MNGVWKPVYLPKVRSEGVPGLPEWDYQVLEYYNMVITILITDPVIEYTQSIHANSGSDPTGK